LWDEEKAARFLPEPALSKADGVEMTRYCHPECSEGSCFPASNGLMNFLGSKPEKTELVENFHQFEKLKHSTVRLREKS